jgi:hypothetical protein
MTTRPHPCCKTLALVVLTTGTLLQTGTCVSDVLLMTVQQFIFTTVSVAGQTVLMNLLNIR